MQRSRAVDQLADKWQQQERNGMGDLAGAYEGELAQQFITEQTSRTFEVRPGWELRQGRQNESGAWSVKATACGVIARLGLQCAVRREGRRLHDPRQNRQGRV